MKNVGYGTVYKTVMLDSRISAASKAVYAYLCTFAGNGDSCFPSKKKICADLAISKNSLGKYLRELSEMGVIEINQTRENGHFAKNVYTITHTTIPCTENTDDRKTVHREVGTKKNIKKINSSDNNNSVFSGGNSVNNNRGATEAYGKFRNVMLTKSEYEDLAVQCADRGGLIERFSAYIEGTGRQYANHYALLLKWAIEDKKDNNGRRYVKDTFCGYDGTVEGMSDFEKREFILRNKRELEETGEEE